MTVIGKWDVSHVTNLSHVFDAARTGKAANFNDDITGWDTGNVLDMSNMFRGTKAFNQNIGNWDVSRVTDMRFMFSDAIAFNQNLENWNMANVAYIGSMFAGATSYNQDVSGWNLGNLRDASSLFYGASSFSRNLCVWVTSLNILGNDLFREAFISTNCPTETNPNFSRTPPGPFCYDCVDQNAEDLQDFIFGALGVGGERW